jgi:predicted TIM-barrel fold metal-dependent hydrolase
MIIDSLTHVTPDGRWFSTSFDASEGRLLRDMDNTGVDKSVVVALAGYIENDFVGEVCARHPDRLIPGASINPLVYQTPKEAIAELRSLRSRFPYAVLKLHPRLNKYDPLDPGCLSFLEEMAAEDSRLPLWLDTLFPYPGASLRKSAVDAIRELVERFPSLTFVLLHACGSDILRLSQSVRDYPNAWIDLSYTVRKSRGEPGEEDFKEAVQRFKSKMVFGSDFPEIALPEALETFHLYQFDLRAEDRASVLGGRLEQILGL